MEIIHLILGKANPDRMNGVNKVVFQLVSEQVKSGRNASVWGVTKDTSHNYGERIFKTKLFKAFKNPFKIDPNLKKELLSLTDIVIHLHGGWIPVYFSLSIFLKRKSIPFVLTPHGAYNVIAMKRSQRFKKKYFKFLERKVVGNAKLINALGESEIAGLQSIYPNNKSILIPYGFYIDENRISKQRDDNNFTIGFVGRIDSYTKGLDILLNAFKRFEDKVLNCTLWVIGDGSDLSQLKVQASELGLKNVVFHGSKYKEEKNNLISQMDLFVHPSRNEGLPTAVIEAASFCIPSLVTQATNIGSYLLKYNAGLSVENESVDAFYNGLIQLYNDYQNGQLKQKGENALEMVKTEFDWSKVVVEFDKLYQL